MPSKKTALCLAMSCLLFTTPALATSKKIRAKPGLWRIDSQTALYGHVVPDVADMIALGPERLQNHVNKMLQQNRVRRADDGSATVCVTVDQIASNRFVNDQGSGCIVSKGKRIGNNIRFNITCGAPKGSGQTDVAIVSPTQWVATTRLSLTVRGMTQDVDNKSYGTWLGSNCLAGQ